MTQQTIGSFTPMGIGQAVQFYGLTPRALRFYEERGLIDVERDARNRRWYDAVARRRLAWISRLRTAGLSLEDIHAVLRADEKGGDPVRCATLQLEHRRKELEDELERVVAQLIALQSNSPTVAALPADALRTGRAAS
jgi:DNA-binding transcriptional MerR regulator